MTDVVNDVIINYESKNLDQTVGGIKQTSVALDGLVVASTSTERATTSLENKFAGLERRFGTTAAQTAQYEKIQKDVNLAVANNPALQDRANEVLKAAEARYLGAGVAVKELAAAHAGLDAQGQAALHSVRSVVEQLALGIPPTQALTGQLNHLTFAATGEGGLAGAFSQVGGLVKNLISPMTVAIGVVGGLTAALAVLANQYDKVQVSSQRAIGGAGQRTGTTASDLNSFTSQNASVAGLSSKDARALGENLTATGDIVISKLHGMSDAVVGFANQTNKSIGDSIKDFEKFGSDPKKALEALSQEFGPVGDGIKNLVDFQSLSIDKTAALNTVLDAYADKLKKAADNATLLDKALRLVSNGWNSTDFAKASGPESQLEAARAKLNAAIEQGSSSNPIDRGFASQDVPKLSQEFEKLQAAREAAIGETATAQLNALNTEAGRAAAQVATIAKFWGDVGTATALALNATYQQAAIAGQVTGQQQQAAQYAADFANASLQGKTAVEAEALASAKLAVSQATATAAVEKQIDALKDQNAMIKAAQTGTEATTAAAIAYKNAIASGADETSAAALKSQTLANYVQQAAGSAQTLDQFIASAAASMTRFVAGQGQSLAYATEMASRMAASRSNYTEQSAEAYGGPITGGRGGSQFDPSVMPKGPLSFSGSTDAGVNKIVGLLQNQKTSESAGIAGLVGSAYTAGGITAALTAIKNAPSTFGADPTLNSIQRTGGRSSPIDYTTLLGAQRSTADEKISAYDQLVQLQNSQTTDKGSQAANLQSEMDFLRTLPTSVARDQKLADLQTSIDQLKSSTDSLNQTNQEALSPYYNQDPRTSHIGFRSQGMASTGYIDIPGVPSANDNMTLTLPVASGERVNVGNGPNRGGQSIVINMPVTIQGNASKDEVGRTMFQVGQSMAKQLAAASR